MCPSTKSQKGLSKSYKKLMVFSERKATAAVIKIYLQNITMWFIIFKLHILVRNKLHNMQYLYKD